ncbi:MAG TPA: DUF1552 domain-containing protein [Polyangiaceae bacterium]|jgi:hypothetical protein|nr:DUF1552 domain-containing protein [Polyangiaceae bacterium]
MIKRLSRRTLLRGVAGVGIALPFLEAMMPRKASGATTTAPRRIMFVFQPNGDQTLRRFTNEDETNFQFDEFLAPLEPYRSEILCLNRLDRRYHNFMAGERADGHQQGGASLAPWKAGTGAFPIGGGNGATVGYVLGPSADYAIGDRVIQADSSVKFRNQVFRVNTESQDIWSVSSHGGPVGVQNPISAETSPFNAYANLFAGDSKDPTVVAALAKTLAMKQSALDNAIGEIATLRAKLGSDDQTRLDQHTQSLRDIEHALQSSNTGAACAPMSLGTPLTNTQLFDDTNHVQIGQLFFQISTWAFACDHVRSINFNWGGNTNNRVYANLGLTDGHHDISHVSTDDAFAQIRQIHKHLWEESVTLHDLLKATPDGMGQTLWDNTLVVHWNELGQGDVHSENDALVVFAGGAGGYFNMGRYIDFANKPSFADMLVSCFQYMGFEDVTSFGDPLLNSNAPLPGLTA